MPTKSKHRPPTQAVLRRAAARLVPPSAPLIPVEQAALERRINGLFARGKVRRAELAEVLDGWTLAKPPRDPRIFDLPGNVRISASTTLSPRASLAQLIRTSHVPVGSPLTFLPKYVHDGGGGNGGYGSGSKQTGRLSAVGHVLLSLPETSTWGVVYSQVVTDLANFGQVSRATLDPEITWTATGRLAIDAPFGVDLSGRVGVAGLIWLVAYELNVATGKFELAASKSHIIFERSFSGLGQEPFTLTGAFPTGSIPMPVIVSPARTFWFGVLAEVRARQNLTLHGKTPSEPSPTQLNSYAVLTVDVPSMLIDHVVLAN